MQSAIYTGKNMLKHILDTTYGVGKWAVKLKSSSVPGDLVTAAGVAATTVNSVASQLEYEYGFDDDDD